MRVFIFHLGNAGRTSKSLQSVLEQNYPHKKIFIVIFNRTELSQLLNFNNVSDVEFIDREFFADRLYNSAGNYVQFVMPGDKLLNNRITTMVELGSTNHCPDIAFSLVNSTMKSNSFPRILEINSGRILSHGTIDIIGVSFFHTLLTNAMVLFGGITGAFFRQKYFSDDNLNRQSFEEWIRDDQMLARQLLLWEPSSKIKLIPFVPERLIDADDEIDYLKTARNFYDIWLRLLEKYHDTGLFSETEYNTFKQVATLVKKDLFKESI